MHDHEPSDAPSRPQGRRRWAAASAALIALVLVAAGCEPAIRTEHGTYVAATLTPDGANVYTITDQGTGFTVSAPTFNTGGNLRQAIFKTDAPTSVDQQACVTWLGPAGQSIQPGLTLRIRSERDRTRAIMVSNNIVFGYRVGFNVHLADSAATPRLVKVGEVQLPDAVGPDPSRLAPLPWRMCARAIGATVELKVWATTTHPSEPAWGDPSFSGRFTVPTSWVYAGRPGFYIGHVYPGESTGFSRGATSATTSGGSSPDAGLTALVSGRRP